MASERYAKFLKNFGPRVTELLDRLEKAARVSERPMTSGDLDILAAASWELLTTTLANMPESQRGKRVRRLTETLAAAVAKKRERLEQKIAGRLDALRQTPPKGST
jgi:aspartate aminotransferase-like enzyme